MSRSVDFLSRASTSSVAGPSRSNTTLPSSCSVLITDTLASPSLFLLTSFISRSLRKTTTPTDPKGKGKAKVVLVGVREVEQEYTNILKKQSVQLSTEKSQGKFELIDGSDGDLQQIYNSVSTSLSTLLEEDETTEGTLVIIDDLSALSWMGNDLKKIVKFNLALKKLCLATRSTLVSVIHSDSISPHPIIQDESDQYVFRKTLQTSDYWFELKSLVSQARGELSIHPGPALQSTSRTGKDERLRTRFGKEALEYTLEENGAVFEVKGLGRFI
ncbi:uncharacterized protein JCM6883_005088 [Sporobolomyces salmoneus]|uniref:uncharacterized protein n=1 Tax=Sporobolomyces salmoneus TaxID=183962 RepID=UPI00316E5962